jgi:hypothetical protein
MNELDLQLRDAINGILGIKPEDELGLGCEVKYLSGAEHMMSDKEYTKILSEDDKIVEIGKVDSPTTLAIYGRERDLPITEILGKPKTLADVLQTINSERCKLTFNKRYLHIDDTQSKEIVNWDLSQDLLGQTEETKKRLLDLLTKTE